MFKINLVYKDAKGQEHELKWLIKVTRSDVNEVAEALLRHEKQGQTHDGTVDNGGIGHSQMMSNKSFPYV